MAEELQKAEEPIPTEELQKAEEDLDFSEFENKGDEPEVVDEPDKEFDISELSDKAASDKYVRTNLVGKTVKLKSIKIIGAKENDPLVANRDPTSKARKKKATLSLYYDTENQDSEHMTTYQFLDDKNVLGAPTIVHEGNGVATHLFRVVARALNVEPKDLSMQAFYEFMKKKCADGAEVEIEGFDTDWNGKKATKNMIKAFK